MSTLFSTNITLAFDSLRDAIIFLSPVPRPSFASTTNNTKSTSLVRDCASLFNTLPNLFNGLWIPGVSTNTI